MGKYAIYNSKKYPVNIRNDKFRLKSHVPETGFQELVDLGGNKHNDIFIREVILEDIELIYELNHRLIFQGKEYEPFAIGKLVIENGKITLFSNDYLDYEQNGFEKKEQFVFVKEVSLDDIAALVEIKKPILKFKGIDEERNIIPKNEIAEYIKNLD